jgi:hypothetical protein
MNYLLPAACNRGGAGDIPLRSVLGARGLWPGTAQPKLEKNTLRYEPVVVADPLARVVF